MILVDTSIWIDHVHARDEHLAELLAGDEVGCHALVIQELALGSPARREETLALLSNLARFPAAPHDELLALVEVHRLWGRELSPTDAHLLAAVRLVAAARLWTGDKRLLLAAQELGVAHER